MKADLIERLRAHPNKFIGHWEDWADEAGTLMLEAADRIAAREAEASEGERRGLERALVAIGYCGAASGPDEPWHDQHDMGVSKCYDAVRALIPEAPAQPELASSAANQISTPEFGLPEAPAREGELEAAAKAIFEQKGLHLSTGKAWERAIRSDRYYCLQYAEAVLIAIGRPPPPPSQDWEPDSQRGAK